MKGKKIHISQQPIS